MTLEPGEGALIPVESGFRIAEVSVVEAALPIEGSVEAVPGVWPTGASQGMLLVAARDEPVALEKGTPVGELRSGFVSSGTCECGTVETILEGDAEDRCGECGAVNSSLAEQFCQTCGRTGAMRQLRSKVVVPAVEVGGGAYGALPRSPSWSASGPWREVAP